MDALEEALKIKRKLARLDKAKKTAIDNLNARYAPKYAEAIDDVSPAALIILRDQGLLPFYSEAEPEVVPELEEPR
jgi:hypothetical protein